METEIRVILQLLLALFLCGSIGLERELKKKGAGLQTYSLVGLAAYQLSTPWRTLSNVWPCMPLASRGTKLCASVGGLFA